MDSQVQALAREYVCLHGIIANKFILRLLELPDTRCLLSYGSRVRYRPACVHYRTQAARKCTKQNRCQRQLPCQDPSSMHVSQAWDELLICKPCSAWTKHIVHSKKVPSHKSTLPQLDV